MSTNKGYSNKMETHYPDWDITKSLQTTIEEIASSWEQRMSK